MSEALHIERCCKGCAEPVATQRPLLPHFSNTTEHARFARHDARNDTRHSAPGRCPHLLCRAAHNFPDSEAAPTLPRSQHRCVVGAMADLE